MHYKFSLILPIYNECYYLRRNFKAVYNEVTKLGGEIIIAEDGSTDCSKELSKKFSALDGVKVISKKERQGRGRAIKSALKLADSNAVGYMDIDLAVSHRFIKKALEKISEGEKIVIGSRYVNGSKVKRAATRTYLSNSYNSLIRFVFGSKLRDHQCGFKFWDYSLNNFVSKVNDNHWFFDSELLILAQKKKIRIYELPVEWIEHKGTKVRWSDIFYFIYKIISFKLELLPYR